MIQYDSHRWFEHFFDIKGSMLPEIIARVTTCAIWSFCVVYWHHTKSPVGIPSTVHSLVGFALGLLLVFRTNASYDRFWEGRKLWGAIVNESRNLVRLSKVSLAKDPELLKEIIHWTIALGYATMHHLRGKADFGHAVFHLSEEKLRKAKEVGHPALGAAVEITQLIRIARERNLITDFLQVALDRNVQLLVDYIGGCERIHKTPLPFAYVVHLRRAMILYCYTLPFGLVESFGWLTIVATFFITYVFFGIEEIGVEIEDPFGRDHNDLPLESICATIEKNLLALGSMELETQKLPT